MLGLWIKLICNVQGNAYLNVHTQYLLLSSNVLNVNEFVFDFSSDYIDESIIKKYNILRTF